MAKFFKIKISSKEKITDISKSETDKEKMTIREIDLIALDSLFSIAANNQSDIKKMNECFDLIGQIKNLSDEKLELNIDKAGLEYLQKAIEQSKGKRPPFWYYSNEMFRSIEKPDEVEI